MGRYVFLEQIALADCAVRIEADDLDDLFETGAAALVEVMVDPATVPLSLEQTIELAAPRVDLLFYDWLSELIFRKDRDREVYPETRVRVTGPGPVTLQARVRGGVIDPARTGLRADAKAVTFHRFAVEQTGAGWRAEVVIDI
jgi:SHS2 domain-containing protein